MSSKSYVIMGEAQESESEEEIDSSAISEMSMNDQMKHSKGKIVFGEAPESDDEYCDLESYDKTSSVSTQCHLLHKIESNEFKLKPNRNASSMESVNNAVSALSAPVIIKKKSTRKHQSILVKKLYERNASLYKNLTEFIEQTATNAGSELNAADKRLLKCQLQLQEGADYLRMLNCNLTVLDSNLQMLLSTKYLPNIRVDKC